MPTMTDIPQPSTIPLQHDTPAIIEVHQLAKQYRGAKQPAVQGVSFTVHEGECFGLLGPNGAGKSTTIGMLTGLLEPSSGGATICGYDIVRAAHRVKPYIGLVPQEIALYPTLTPRENLHYFGRLYHLRGAELQRRVDDALAMVGLSERANDTIEHLSGGMKRRVNLAAGLFHHPKVVFLDEPTVGVDPQSRSFIFAQIEALKRTGMTLIYTTHYMEEAERLCDRIAIIDQGVIQALDTPRALIEQLEGGMLLISVPTAVPPFVVQRLRTLQDVIDAQQVDSRLTIKSQAMHRALPAVMATLNEQSVEISAITLNEPSLEVVFLELTGRQLRD